MNWLPWLMGGGTIALLLVLALVPGALAIATPIIKAIVEGVIELLTRLWRGFVYTVKNLDAMLLLAAVAMVAFGYGYKAESRLQKQVTKSYERTVKSVPKQVKEEAKRWQPSMFGYGD